MSLPTKEQFEELKKKRKQEMERKRILERQVGEVGTLGAGFLPAVSSPQTPGGPGRPW